MLTSPSPAAGPWPRAWALGLLVLCGLTLWTAFRQIDATLPYPRHVDEAFITGPAQRTVVTGNLHPYTFNYPSVPKYLAAAAMAAGFLQSASRLEVREVREIGNVGYPYYEVRGPMQTARRLYVLLSVVALAMTGVLAWLAFGRPALLVGAPLVLLLSPLYVFHTWTYLNVDIVATCFVSLTLASTLYATRTQSVMWSGVVPGACAGLATGSKYTLAVVFVAVLLGIVLFQPAGTRIRAAVAALASMVVAFLLGVPYSVVDIPGFLNGLGAEAFHYASGHRGYNEEPGLRQLFYYLRHFASEFGVGGFGLALVGFALFAWRDWRRAAVLGSFPFVLLWMLSSQRVHFPRNVLSVHPVIALFAAEGLALAYGWIRRAAVRTSWLSRASRPAYAGLMAGLLFVVVLPVQHLVGSVRVEPDSRNLAVKWLLERTPPDWTIVVPDQLGMDTRPLEAAGRRVAKRSFQSATDDNSVAALLGDVPRPAVLLVPRWGADPRFPNGEKAPALNATARRWRVLREFGSKEVLVNYSYSTPWGDPAFAVCVLK